ncbi:RibD family protein, partial [Pseudorhodoplanes sp.]|uniref:RibD family protein n=1 Tax=Pseudorhodoplanes sp. TaxID=1934341 RepID=UPI0039196F92
RGEGGPQGLDLPAVLRALCERGITRLMVEGGPKVAASLLRAGLVDEAWLLRGTATIGSGGIDALDGLPLNALTEAPDLALTGNETVGGDSHFHYERHGRR